MKRTAFAALAIASALSGHASASTVTFESPALGSGSYSDHGTFTENGVTFANDLSVYDSWSGFARSNVTNNTTAGYTNQYSSFTGGGANGSATYAVGYESDPLYGIAPSFSFDGQRGVVSTLQITNTTYAAISMRDGDGMGGPGKKFGGTSGNDPDYLRLTISGFASGTLTNSVDFYLADFRFSDHSQDYIVNEWTSVDLSSLGWVNEIRFNITSSDVGIFGINTPAYFALDNIQFVPEPSAALLSLLGLLPLLRRKR